jgi:tetratricopeptide (TPR) repeat protein
MAFGLALLAATVALLEVVLRVADVGASHLYEDPFVGFAGGRDLFVRTTDRNGESVYRTSPEKLAFFNEQEFAATKGSDTFRIFALGGSTTAGRPYDAEFAFPAWLGRFLDASTSERRFEVVNAGGISYASYRIALLMRELVRYEPDLFVIYTGHNEFLEERTYSDIIHANPAVKAVRRHLNGLRSYTVARHAVRQLSGDRDVPSTLDEDVSTRLDGWRGLELYHRDPELRSSISAHFEYNLRQMVAIADDADVPVLFVMPVGNLKDFSPFKSEFGTGIETAERRRIPVLLDAARHALASADPRESCTLAAEAVNSDPLYAAASYVHGRCLLALDRDEEAKAAFISARDQDVAPLRAPGELLDIIATVTADVGAPIIDLPTILEEDCRRRLGHTILGSEYLLDHVHPDIPVHSLIAERILDHLVEEDVVAAASLPAVERRREIFDTVVESMDERYYAQRDLNLAKVLGWAGKLAEAEAPLRRAAAVLDEEPEVFLNLGIVLQRTGRLEEAAAQLERTLELDPDSAPALFNLGVVFSATDRPGRAASAFRRALELQPDYPEALYNLAIVEQRRGNWPEALRLLERTRELRDDRADIHRRMALVYYHLGRSEEATLSLAEASRIDGGTASALAATGIDLASKGRPGEAEEALELALELEPDNPEALFGMGVVHSAAGDVDRAIDVYRQAIAADPAHARALNNVGILLARRGDLDGARRALSRAIEIDPDYADARFNLGVVHDASGQPQRAIASIERAIEIDPDNARYHQALALLLAAVGEEEKARAHFERSAAATAAPPPGPSPGSPAGT